MREDLAEQRLRRAGVVGGARDPLPVLIVGAGVTGLALAIELRRRGIPLRIIDRLDEFPASSRGKGVQPRTQEVFDDMGILAEIHAHSIADMRLRVMDGAGLVADLDLIMQPSHDVPYPNIVYLPEWRTEGIMRERLGALGVTVERSRELVALEQSADGVWATVRHTATGEEEQIFAQFVVGSDGGKSTVRRLLGLSFEGATKPEHFLIGDVQVAGLPRDGGYAWLHHDGLVGLGLLEGGDAWQIILELAPDSPLADEPPTLELFQRLFAERTGRAGLRLISPTWLSHFPFNRRMVDRYRVGRVFVAGDAAHVHSPAGGQSMNTGIQDAYNLGWKLAAVVQGKAPEALLDSYQAERMPVAAAMLKGSSIGHDAIFSDHPLMRLLREWVLLPMLSQPAVKRALSRSMAQLGISYRESPLSHEQTAPLRETPLLPGRTRERAGLAERFSFQQGPHAGDRAPDAHGRTPAGGRTTRLFDLFRGAHWTLLLFDGLAQTDEGYERLARIALHAEDLLAEDVRVAVVVVGDERPAALDWHGIMLLDPEREVHQRYGAASEALYLIRPDGYVGFGSQPADALGLLAYLERVLPAVVEGRLAESVPAPVTSGAGGCW